MELHYVYIIDKIKYNIIINLHDLLNWATFSVLLNTQLHENTWNQYVKLNNCCTFLIYVYKIFKRNK